MDSIYVAQHKVQWWGIVNIIIDLQALKREEIP
jgi:hypothetical protein